MTTLASSHATPLTPTAPPDAKLWAGQVYLSHTSEINAKLLYKKFYRNTDCTILYGKWSTILQEQKGTSDDSAHDESSGEILTHKEHKRSSSANSVESDIDPRIFNRSTRRFSDPTLSSSGELSVKLPAIQEEASNSLSPPFPLEPMDSPRKATFLLPHLSPIASRTLRRVRAKHRLSTPTQGTLRRDKSGYGRTPESRQVSSSRHGVVNPRELELIQCFVLFYASCWAIPNHDARRLDRIFGPDLVFKIERYIRDKLNGEQGPGTSFLVETGSIPCKYIVCTSVARSSDMLSNDYAYNAFRSSLQAIHAFNRTNQDKPIVSILCPALECINSIPYNLVQQMVTCYEHWDWHVYASGSVLPVVHGDIDVINRDIQLTAPAIPKIAEDLEQYIWAGMLVARGLVYEVELNILLFWMEKSDKGISKKLPGVHKPAIPKYKIAQLLVDILKKPDTPPFTLTPSQIYSGICGGALEYILEVAIEGHITIYDDIMSEELIVGDTIAHGTSGRVTKAVWGNVDVAVKYFNSYQPHVFRNELTLITLARHPKLVFPYGGHCDEKETYIVTELMETNLYQFIQKKRIDFPTKLKIAKDVAEAMEFLHGRNITHRDLKSVNVLLNLTPELTAKVCDFGLSRVVDDTHTMTGNIGTVAWIAPEIFQNKKYTEKCDVYSYGLLLYELLTQLLPFKDLPSFKIPIVVMKGQRPIIPEEATRNVPKEFINLIKQCWHENPVKRPVFAQIILRITALQPNEKINDTEPSVHSETDELGSTSTSSFSLGDQETSAMDELKSILGARNHSKLVTEELLAKALLARRGKVKLAKKEWYNILNEGKALRISDVRKTLEEGVLFLPGATDKDGRTIIYWDAAKYNVDLIPEPDLIRCFVYCLERATERPDLHAKGIVIVGNFKGFTMANFSTRIMNSFFGTLRKYFPVVLHKLFFVNSPPWISRVITMSQSFSSIMSNIDIISSEHLFIHITPDNLFPCMNGTFSFDMERWIRSRYEIEAIEYL